VVIYRAILEDYVWVGIGSTIMRTTVPSHTMIPAGSVIRTASDVRTFRFINEKEEKYQANVFSAAAALREGYAGLYESTGPEIGCPSFGVILSGRVMGCRNVVTAVGEAVAETC